MAENPAIFLTDAAEFPVREARGWIAADRMLVRSLFPEVLSDDFSCNTVADRNDAVTFGLEALAPQ